MLVEPGRGVNHSVRMASVAEAQLAGTEGRYLLCGRLRPDTPRRRAPRGGRGVGVVLVGVARRPRLGTQSALRRCVHGRRLAARAGRLAMESRRGGRHRGVHRGFHPRCPRVAATTSRRGRGRPRRGRVRRCPGHGSRAGLVATSRLPEHQAARADRRGGGVRRRSRPSHLSARSASLSPQSQPTARPGQTLSRRAPSSAGDRPRAAFAHAASRLLQGAGRPSRSRSSRSRP